MRIQHNIMAMSAYRNYNTNTSAVAKNLEKLSSGYKINRAGDDAAGLAISEKMRAQITGLNAAQKNVKDGISLVKTAEGAMQEIQDMLNRMDYLATQSANGTYDNEVDRAALQKEVDQLRTEINRIADSANFNGIKLLDGSLDGSAKAAVAGKVSEIDIAKVGSQLGVDTILHQEGSGNGEATTFKVDLADFQFAANDGETMTVKVGDNTFELTADNTAQGPLTGEDIVAAITGEGTAPTGVTVKLNGTAYTAGSDVAFGGQDFEVSAEGNKLVFTQKDAPTTEAEEVDGKMDVVISGATNTTTTKAGWTTGVYTAGTNDAGGTGMQDDAKATVTVTVPDSTGGGGADETLTFDTAALANDATIDDVIAAMKASTATNANGDTLKLEDLYDVTATATGEINLALKDGVEATVAGFAYTQDTGTVTGTDTKATMAAGAVVNPPADGNGFTTGGDFNVQTIEVTNGTAEKRDRLASTVVTLTEDMFQDGAEITIADKTIKVSADAADKDDPTKVYIGDMVGDGKTLDLKVLSERLSQAAAGNNAWTVSAIAGKPGITLMEKTNADGTSAADAAWDLTTEKGIKETLSFKSADTAAVAADDSKSLTLQIGDTSESFNQMKVSVGDMHVDAMGTGKYIDENGNEVQVTKTIADIDISNQQGAAEAINVIKNAINYVSGVRGDLGAVQNRLEHTANNLSVMAENIQDAESTIRDTDIAEEMMSYTKNNILVQSAQAMLAQANQVPQGVLQLLG
jgi:flagellin